METVETKQTKQMSTTTKYRLTYWSLAILSVLLQLGPLVTYGIIGYVQSDLVTEKVGLSLTVFIVAILTVVAFVNKVAMRSRLWIMLLGLYFALDYIMTPLLIIAICQIVDELIAAPLKKHYKTKLTISKEIDKRA